MRFQAILRTRLQKSIEDNKHLQDQVSELNRQRADSSALSGVDNKELGKRADSSTLSGVDNKELGTVNLVGYT